MKLKFHFVWILILGFAAPAWAWDFDFHFHATYLICRDLGMTHEFCRMAAASAEWTDQSLVSGPFFIPKAREFNHFNGPYHDKTLQQSDVGKLAAWFKGHVMVSHPDSAVPHALFMDALKEHDLIAALMHLHTIQDLDPHARFYSSAGHPTEGHWPDRYWLNEDMMNKFKASVRKTYHALWAVRALLPKEALDLDEHGQLKGSYFGAGHDAATMNNPDLLAARFLESPEMKGIYTRDFLHDPEYVVNGLVWFFERFKERGIVNANLDYNALIPPGMKIDGSRDLPSTLVAILAQGEFMKGNDGQDLFHMDRLMRNVFPEFQDFQAVRDFYVNDRISYLSADGKAHTDLQSEAEEEAKVVIADRITTYLSKGFIPIKLGSKDYVDMFEADVIRKKEMDIRQNAWNDVIEKLTGKRIAFEAKLLRTAGKIGDTMRALPYFHPELFAHRHIHNGHEDTELISVPTGWRRRWAVRQFKKILLRRTKYIQSPAFAQGALNYYQPAAFDKMVKAGTIKPYSSTELRDLDASYHAVTNRLFEKVHDWLSREGDSLPVPPDAAAVDQITRGGEVANCVEWLKKL